MPPHLLQVIFAASWLILMLLIYGLRRAAERRTSLSVLGILFGLMSVCAGGLLLTRTYVVDEAHYGIVVNDSAARNGPGKQYDLQMQVSNSVKVTLGGVDRGWRQVTLPNGQGAWMPSDMVRPLQAE
jgi:uncharacterized protein YgiM (DUF1202 family)